MLILGSAQIFRHHVQRRCRNIKRIRSGVADHDIVLFKAVHLHLFYAGKAADAVNLVDDEIPRSKVCV